MSSSYSELEKRWNKISHIEHAMALMSWDESTLMPAGGGEARAEAKAGLSAMAHEILVQADSEELLEKAEKESLDDWQKANLSLMKRLWKQSQCLPTELIRRSSEASSRCEQAWRIQRQENNWKAHLPLLEEVLKVKREAAQIKSENFGLSAYDSLLETYEPGLRSSEINQLFASVRKEIPALLQEVLARQEKIEILTPQNRIPASQQEALGKKLMKSLGFDFNRGRLDTSHHPFCGGVPDDVRLTTRYSETDFVSSLMGILHETGHAKYQQNLPKKWRGQPVGDALGMSIHESQSLLIEMQICRSRAFIEFLRPLMIQDFQLDEKSPVWSIENLYRFYNRVRPGYIRVDADELTYPLHILLRFELEQDLIEARLEAKDLPEAWNEKMKSYLGIDTSGNFKDGCMQDIHWPVGLFGYFPCYSVGAMVAAQFAKQIKADLPELETSVRKGELGELMEWLEKKIHSKGSFLKAPDLVKEVTGKDLSSDDFISHLKKRYLEV